MGTNFNSIRYIIIYIGFKQTRKKKYFFYTYWHEFITFTGNKIAQFINIASRQLYDVYNAKLFNNDRIVLFSCHIQLNSRIKCEDVTRTIHEQ